MRYYNAYFTNEREYNKELLVCAILGITVEKKGLIAAGMFAGCWLVRTK